MNSGRFEPFGAAEARLKRDPQCRLVEAEAVTQQPHGFHAVRAIGIALSDVSLGDAMERGENDLRLELETGELGVGRGGERLDIGRVVVIGWRDAQRRLVAQARERAE